MKNTKIRVRGYKRPGISVENLLTTARTGSSIKH